MPETIKYRNAIAKILNDRIVKEQEFNTLKDFPIVAGKQAMYIMDWQKSQLVYVHGIYEMLGYTEAEFTMELAMNYIHPDDLDIVTRILKGVINLATDPDIRVKNEYLNVTFRLLKKDGMYLKVMRQSSPYQTDQDGRFISNVSVITDISFMNATSNLVEWELFADNVDISKFKQNIYKEFSNFFTTRELEIVHLIKNDFTNKKIAVQLFISQHTVVAHRKNIYKKSNCHNSKELLKFCKQNRII